MPVHIYVCAKESFKGFYLQNVSVVLNNEAKCFVQCYVKQACESSHYNKQSVDTI